ncbi:unnamed protein product [Arabidopsis lyrata]|uniref:Predicted protein n=1 Tax=Arabidopsis lyrata subsp. lyrata TaxID=81972 RepID=D7KQB0_ARALL|nr:predicted protein [Arabidopsis lyrata subsp. lyrata]CAH8250876.1 unnamed protein product [Arabidopsis lyrata]
MSLCFSEEELDIDDIDIDDHHHSQQQEKPKEQGILSRLSKQKMVNRFSNFKRIISFSQVCWNFHQ